MNISVRRKQSEATDRTGNVFEDMGITYLGPIQGHSIPMLVRALKSKGRLRDLCCCMSLTKKREKDMNRQKEQPDKFHGIGPFKVETGEPEPKKKRFIYRCIWKSNV